MVSRARRSTWRINALTGTLSPAAANSIAVIAEGEDGVVRRLSYGRAPCRDLPAGELRLRILGIGQGDAVGLFLPMIPEAVIGFLACAKLGAIAVPIFSGFGAQAVAARLEDCSAKALLTVHASSRRGHADRHGSRRAGGGRGVPERAAMSSSRGRPGGAAAAAVAPGCLDWGELVRHGGIRTTVGRARSGNSAHDCLHIGNDRAAQGGGARARGVSW